MLLIMILQLETLTDNQLVSEEEKAALHTRYLATISRKRKKPASAKDAVQMDETPFATSMYSFISCLSQFSD